MGIIRGQISSDGFTIVPNHWLRDPRLSFKAKGILAYVASHRADYDLTLKQMIAESREKRDAIHTGLRELVDAGYLAVERRRDEGGRLRETDYRIIENPESSQVSTRNGLSSSGKPSSGKSDPKKNRFLENDFDLREDQKTPPLAPSEPEPPAVVRPEPVVVSNIDEPQTPNHGIDAVEVAVAELVALTGWSPGSIRSVLLKASASGERPWKLVVAAARLCFTAPDTKAPARLMANGIWWKTAARDLAAAQPRTITPRPRVDVPAWREERGTATEASAAARAAARAAAARKSA